MIDLFHTLQDTDLGYLKTVADLWGLEIPTTNRQTAIQALSESMLDPDLVNELVSALPHEAIEALQGLLEEDGVMSWALFCNRYGELRLMGPAKRDRERPDLYPSSATEILWYRALIGKAFLDLEVEPQEYAYVPEDLVPFLIPLTTETVTIIGRPASPKECEIEFPVDDQVLDDICTTLSAIRMDVYQQPFVQAFQKLPAVFTLAVMRAASLIEEDLSINPETSLAFLEDDRGHALSRLVELWSQSEKINELKMLPELKLEGNWLNRPLETRKNILELISTVPEGTWWSLPAFIASVEEKFPDFQRPTGDYDSWFILDKQSGEYLRGRSSWPRVEGALLRFMICGPLHWLGLVDLASSSGSAQPSAFRISKWGQKLWYGAAPDNMPAEEDKFHLFTDGRMRLTNLVPRFARYQVARFGNWEQFQGKEYIYRVTSQSMRRAAEQGLKSAHLLTLLKKYAGGEIPISTRRVLDHWDRFGNQVNIFTTTLLQVEREEIMAALLKSDAKRYVVRQLDEKTAIVQSAAVQKLRDALFQLGYLTALDQ